MALKNGASLLLLAVLFLFGCATTKNMTPTAALRSSTLSFPLSDTLLTRLLEGSPQFFSEALGKRDEWRIQVIYSQIDRDEKNSATVTHHYFNVDPSRYFYPASTVKMPAAFLALQRLNELNIPGLNKYSAFLTEAAAYGQTAVEHDSSSADGKPSVAHYIKKIFLVSDNDAYNRLYEFLGQDYLNRTLHNMGYDSVQLLHRLQVSLSDEQNRTTNPVSFLDPSGRVLYRQPLVKSNLAYVPRTTFLGNGFLRGEKVVNEPFDFSKKNRITLPDLHSILQSVVLPETVPAVQRFRLTDDDYRFLYRYMSMKPGESDYPKYDTAYSDAYVKFLLFGGKGQIENKSLRIFNKVGDAYGFLQDVAYVVDFDEGVEFLLSATIYCNSDGIFNDDKYDYETVGFPFLKHLGEVIYAYEKQRHKKYKPNLSKFRMYYKTQR